MCLYRTVSLQNSNDSWHNLYLCIYQLIVFTIFTKVGGYHCVAIKKSDMEDGQNHTYKTTALCHLLSLCMCCCIARCSNDIFGQPESRREMTYYRICLYILIYSGSVLCSATGYDYCIPTWKTSKLDSDYAFFRLLQAAVVFCVILDPVCCKARCE